MFTPAQQHRPASSPRSGPLKRKRITRACDSCKSRKRKCNGEIPCDLCISQDLSCSYEATYSRGRVPTPKPARLSDRHVLGQGAANPITETSRVPSPAGDPVGQYLGPTSPFSFLRRACRRFGRGDTGNGPSHDCFEQAPVLTTGDRKMPLVDTSMLLLPDRETTAALLDHYFSYAAPTYRFLHKPTVVVWLEKYHLKTAAAAVEAPLTTLQEAVVLLVLATASVYDYDPGSTSGGENASEPSMMCELFFQAAQQRIAAEIGRPCLDSVQARLLTSLLLLNTSRLNQAWYTFGTTVQMIYALGIHRSRRLSTHADHIVSECQKRCFWSAYQLDAYLCIILGRPPLLNENDIDQHFPEAVHDEDISMQHVSKPGNPRDCPITAAILHQKLSRIIKRASRAQNDVQQIRGQQLVDTVRQLITEIDQWREGLPVVLSGAVHPSSLVVVFRRQVTVLHVASLHATLLATRPLLLSAMTNEAHDIVTKCVMAAKEAIEVVKEIMEENSMFPANWNFQYVAFHALSIVYVWIIQWKHGRLASLESRLDPDDLFALAQAVQHHLAKITQSNAPGLRYSIILEELEQEARHLLRKSDAGSASRAVTNHVPDQTNFSPTTEFDGAWEALSAEFPLDPDLWSQLNYFPFSGDL